jgi:iron-sulfur cluster assembly accessory protein
MLEVSEKAAEVMKEFLKEREEPRSIRILMTEGGWKGAYLVMAFDEKQESDQVFTEKGLTFLIEKTLLSRVQPVKIDYVDGTLGAGFTLRSEFTKAVTSPPLACESLCGHC